ncbi:recombinase family protein [Celeribacter indicus]|uniref:Resolvase-like protein n=1 Tax=Celeribacter indicus TaxID=1208324 RepID=A0A0B5DSW6_9RHOB|nr:recombinase family protein [Celeribacter indicus]AJE46144.1 resolvase-like protein [Celeribacter indicus]SDX36923.1 Site-specific DNA recombinase [Celeribacter indicus]
MDCPKTPPRRAAIYARVSTGEQTPENQLIRLREVAERAGWAVVCEYVETASGASRARPGLDAMMKDAARRRFDVVMAWDVSRLGRSLRDLVDLFETLRSVGCDLFLEQQALDTSTPAGRALLQMSGVFAEFERAMIVERTKAGMARARARGKQIGRAPASDALIDAIRALRADGMGMDRIARNLKCGKGLSQRVCQEFDKEMEHG